MSTEAGTPFSALYEAVQVATGNDDPVVGPEVMPSTRMDVLIRTGANLLPSYYTVFPTVSYVVNDDQSYSLVTADGVSALNTLTQLAIAYVAAHRYFIGIGSDKAADAAMERIGRLAAILGGEPMFGYKEIGLIPERLQNI